MTPHAGSVIASGLFRRAVAVLAVLILVATAGGTSTHEPIARIPPTDLAGDVEPQTVSSFTIDEPTEEVTLAGLPEDFELTFSTAAFHVYGRYRAIIWLEGPEFADLAVRTIPLPITGDDPAGPVTQTESVTVPEGTPAGLYTLCVRAEENWPPGSESWGFSMTDCVPDIVRIGGVLDSVEFTQAIQAHQDLEDLQADGPEVPIVAGKDAMMRVYFDELDDPTDVQVTVTGSVEGSESTTITPNCDIRQQRRRDGCHSVDFTFTPGAQVSVTIEVTDSEGATLDEEQISFSTVQTIPLEIVALRVCDREDTGADEARCAEASTIGSILGFTEAVYPVASVTPAVEGVSVGADYDDFPDEDAWWSAILADIRRERQVAGDLDSQRHWYGTVHQDVGTYGGMGYQPPAGHPQALQYLAAAGKTTIPGADGILAHELGHNRSLHHAPCSQVPGVPMPDDVDPNWPDEHPGASINQVGFDVDADDVVDGLGDTYYDLMSYCWPQWIAAYHYERLVGQLGGGGAQGQGLGSAATGAVWLVEGHVTPEGGVELAPLYTFDDRDPSPGTHGDWTVAVLDAGGGVLAEHAFEAFAGTAIDGPGVQHFVELVPVRDGAVTLSVRDADGVQHAAVDLGGSTPEVELTSPAGGEVWDGVQTLAWSATGTAPLSYRVEYSSDGGETWAALAHGTSAPELSVDFAPLAGGAPGQSLVRVFASDGVNSASAVSQAFSVTGSAPTVEILRPAPDQALREGQPLRLRASALDPDDGLLQGSAVVWESDVDGPLGDGDDLRVPSLSEGEHDLTVTATDSDGNSASASVPVVVDGTAPVIDVTVAGERAADPGEILVVRTTSVSASIETSLLELGLSFTTVFTDDFASLDLGGYDTIVVGMDGGDIGEADVQALRAAADDGKRLVLFGGTPTATFASAVDEHLVAVDTGATDWQQPATPHLEVTDPDHPLAWRLPDTFDFPTLPFQVRNASEYMLRVTDPDVSVAAHNGDGHPALFSALGGGLVWMVNTPWGAIWGDPSDTTLLNQVLSNALELVHVVPAPASVTIAATDGPGGSGLSSLRYSLDGGSTWVDAPTGPDAHAFEVTEDGPATLLVRAGDRAGNVRLVSERLFVTAPPDPLDKDDCKDGGWEDLGFRNQGLCMRYVLTGQGGP